jgi:hypothetical protein
MYSPTEDRSSQRPPLPSRPSAFQRFRVTSSQGHTQKESSCNAILDIHGYRGNLVSAAFLEDLGVPIPWGNETVVLKIVAEGEGPVRQGLTYRVSFSVDNRPGLELLLGTDWLDDRKEQNDFYDVRIPPGQSMAGMNN